MRPRDDFDNPWVDLNTRHMREEDIKRLRFVLRRCYAALALLSALLLAVWALLT